MKQKQLDRRLFDVAEALRVERDHRLRAADLWKQGPDAVEINLSP